MFTLAHCSSCEVPVDPPSAFPGCSIPIPGSGSQTGLGAIQPLAVSHSRLPSHRSNIVSNWVQLSKDVSTSSHTGFCWGFCLFDCLFFCYRYRLLLTKTRAHFKGWRKGSYFERYCDLHRERCKSEPRTEALLSVL